MEQAKQPVITERFDNTPTGMKALKNGLSCNTFLMMKNSLLVIENTGVYHRLMWSFCRTHNLPLHIGNAAHIKWSLGITRGKNDVIDSKRLSMYCLKQADELNATPVLDPVFMKLKDLRSSHSRLLTQLHSTKNYLNEIKCTDDKALLTMLDKAHKAAIEGIKKSIEQIEAMIEKVIQQNQAIYSNYNLIKTVPGIGHLTAIYIYISSAAPIILLPNQVANNWAVMQV